MAIAFLSTSAVALKQVDGLHWLGRFFGKKFHLPTKQLLGSIRVAAIFSTFVHTFESAPKLLMAVVQQNIGL